MDNLATVTFSDKKNPLFVKGLKASMYKSKDSLTINEDVNGSYNIMVKELNNFGEILNRSLVSFHTRGFSDYNISSNKYLIEKHK